MKLLLELPPGQARRLEAAELQDCLTHARLLKEVDSGMTGPIRVLAVDDGPERWILEADTRRRPVLRRLQSWQNAAEFIQQRQDSYERMWDG